MIESIQLKNFKCFDYVKIPLKNVNLLTGFNGMGSHPCCKLFCCLDSRIKAIG